MKKDDIITLTQTPSGGWWEGTLDGITGWFPANHVTPTDINFESSSLGASNLALTSELSGGSGPLSGHFSSSEPGSLTGVESQSLGYNGENITEYRAIVIKDIEDSEHVFIGQLQDAINLYLKPMYQYKIFPSDSEINAVLRSITEICTVHRRFLTSIDKNKLVSPKENRIGGLFLQFAPQFKHAHFEYCSHHAKFVHLIEKFKKEICSFFVSHPHQVTSSAFPPSPSITAGTNTPNVLITSSLSVSFRRLDKYPALLQELQRYTEESHVDRGDTQRAGFLYREIAMSCLELRRRKEMELEVMLGNIRNFDGLKVETYGNIQRMEPVSILILPPWSEPKKDCYLVLFAKVLMVLSVGNELTSFSYESMLQLERARMPVINFADATKQGDSCARLEIQGNSAHPLSDSELVLTYVVQFNDEEVCKDWYQQLQKQIRLLSAASMPDLIGAGNAINGSSSSSSLTTTSPPSGSSSSSISSPQSSSSVSSSVPPIIGKPPVGLGKPPHPPTTPPPPVPPLPQHRPFIPGTPSRQVLLQNASTAMLPRRGSFWSDKILTAHAPHRPESGSGVQSSGSLDPNEDIQLLNVIDAYYRKIPGVGKDLGGGKTRKLSSSNMPDLELEQEGQRQMLVEIFESVGAPAEIKPFCQGSHGAQGSKSSAVSLQSLATKLNQMSLSSSAERSILYEFFEQLRQIQNQMNRLNENFKDERRHRKRLQEALYRKVG